jgi:hypothetical protein
MRWTLMIFGLNAVALSSALALPRTIQETIQSAAATPDSEIYFAGAITLGIFALARRRVA